MADTNNIQLLPASAIGTTAIRPRNSATQTIHNGQQSGQDTRDPTNHESTDLESLMNQTRSLKRGRWVTAIYIRLKAMILSILLFIPRLFIDKRSRITDTRDKGLVKKNLDRYPQGYPRFSAYIDSTYDTVLFRRFGILHARSLLYLQVELNDLEAKLDALDKADGEDDSKSWRVGHSIHFRDGSMNEERKVLVEKIYEKLDKYDTLLLHDANLRKLNRPSVRVHRNFMDRLYTEHPFSDDDERFVYHEHDFVTLQEYERGWLDESVHKLVGRCNPIRNLFVGPEERGLTENQYLYYYSEYRLGILIKTFIAVSSTAFLMAPTYLFITVTYPATIMALITFLFTFCFAVAISTFTSAKRFEVFAATAAYCAVLVVFIGNTQQRKMGDNG